MREVLFEISANDVLAKNVFRMTLRGDTEGIRAGQFVNIQIPGFYLRRPISAADAEDGSLTIIYKAVGRGTEELSRMLPGDYVAALTGLGNGYDLSLSGESPLLLGGGVGVPPLYMLAKKLIEEGKRVRAVLGFNTAEEVFYEEEFRELGCEVTVTTADGSYGEKGFVTDALPEEYSFFYACGPLPMLKAVYKKSAADGQFSLEERMGCGFGACMGCSIMTKGGAKRVCREGPVFGKGELLWDGLE